MQDPRYKNDKLDHTSLAGLKNDYARRIASNLVDVDEKNLFDFVELLNSVGTSGRKIFLAGNGGSASIAEHAACDLTKGTFFENKFRISAVSLSSNLSLITAISNDFSYEEVYSFQLETMAKDGDALLLISSSGNSLNIVKAADKAKTLGVRTVGLTGFDGGILRERVDISFHVNSNHYGLVEDTHMSLIHMAIDIFQQKYLA